MRALRTLAALASAAMIFSACGGGGGHVVPSTSSAAQGVTPYTGPSSLTYAWNQSMLQDASYVGPVPSDARATINVSLRMRNEQGLTAYAAEASDPHSPLYRQWLTPQEIGQRFGASDGDVKTAQTYFNQFGLTFSTWPQHLTGVVHGPVAALESAFGVKFGIYRIGAKMFLAPASGSPHFSQAIPVPAAMLASGVTPAHTFIIRFPDGAFAGYAPQQIARGFDYSGAWGAGLTGTGINVGIIGTGPIDIGTNEVTPKTNGGDVGVYQKAYREIAQFGLAASGTSIAIVPASPQPASTIGSVSNPGTGAFDPDPTGLATPPPVTAPCSSSDSFPSQHAVYPSATCNEEDGEAQLDTESVAGLAPNASVLFYLAYNPGFCATPNNCPTDATGVQGLFLADDEIQQAIADDRADALSLSYGLGENGALGFYFDASGAGIGPDEFAALAAEGIAVFVSSGDNGNQSCFDNAGLPLGTPCVSYPASDPSVVAVGGVNIPLDPSGALNGQIAAWADQTTSGGNGSFGNNVGSGGGVSQYLSSTYQTNAGVTVPTGSQPASQSLGGKRGVPDIALDADPLTGPSITMNANLGGGGYGAFGGTSAAAPEAAAQWALVLQACKASSSCNKGGATGYRLGNPDGLFYAIYKSGMNGLAYANVFYDVLYGENQANSNSGTSASPSPGPPITGCCTSGPGYDLVTGLGSPFAGHLVQAVTGTKVP